MSKHFWVLGITFCFVVLNISGVGSAAETERLIIRDITGKSSPEKFERLVSRADWILTNVLRFWSSEARVNELGKIIVEIDHALPKASTSIFFGAREKGTGPGLSGSTVAMTILIC